MSPAVRPHALRRTDFQAVLDGQRTDLFTLRGAGGLQVAVCNHAARIVQVLVPHGSGDPVDVVLGYDSLAGYLQGQPSMGAFIARWAGRLGDGRLCLLGREHRLPVNAPPHCLHGGPGGSRGRVFTAEQTAPDTLLLQQRFTPQDDGFPGTLALTLRYQVTAGNALRLDWRAEAPDQPTLVNVTSHAFFNLCARGDVREHQLTVPASRFAALDPTLCPTGELRPVRGRALDFRRARPLGEALASDDPAVRAVGGLDHYLVLDDPAPGLRRAARLQSPAGGPVMEVWSTEPGLQVYAGHGLTGQRPRDLGRGGWLHTPASGLCLEPMGYPDAPNHPAFPFQPLFPGQVREGAIEYRFLAGPG